LKKQLVSRIKSRRTEISNVLQYLHNGPNISKNDHFTKINKNVIATFITKLLKRLLNKNASNNSTSEVEIEKVVNDDLFIQGRTMKEKLYNTLKETLQSRRDDNYNDISTKEIQKAVKKEMELFEKGSHRGKYLKLAYAYLITVKPTSIESERAFSTAGWFCSKIRSNLGEQTLHSLCFLRAYFLKKEVQKN
jgi:hypothetical protein